MGHRTVRSTIGGHPLLLPLLAGFALRLAAGTLGSGYLMHDDHFLVLEAAGSWADGEDYNDWLPWNQKGEPKAHPANLTYVGSQYVVISILQRLGLHHPGTQAYVIRLLHALYSLLIIPLGYGLARSLNPERHDLARLTAWILSISGLWPLLSVHQLVEMVCIPPLLFSFSQLARSDFDHRQAVLAGIGLGMATGIRYQCGLIGLGLVPVLLLQRQTTRLVVLGSTALLTFSATQVTDWFIWGEPFTQLGAYLNYNNTHSHQYPQGPWYQYLLTMGGLLVPPVSLMLLWGAFHPDKGRPAGWWRVLGPVLLFLVFHSAYANKQERFILPIVPAIIVLGTLGWAAWSERSRWWSRHRTLERSCWWAFWTLSTAFMMATLPYQAKQSRVSAMEFLRDQHVRHFAMVQVDSGSMPPLFYSGTWEDYHIDDRRTVRRDPARLIKGWCQTPPEFILFQGDRHLGEAVSDYKSAFPRLRYVTTFNPSRIDRWLGQLNPLNSSERIMVYAVDDALPCP